MKLHIGCGKRDFGDDWVHIDGSSYPHVKYHSITELPFDDDSVELIYASHVIEYFDREEIVDVLKNWIRCLKPNGILRIAVPDFHAIAKLYIEGKYPLEKFLGPMYGKWKMTETETIYHRTVYDRDSLTTLLKRCGLKNIELWDWRKTEHSHFDDYSQAFLPHLDKENGILVSLNIQAQK